VTWATSVVVAPGALAAAAIDIVRSSLGRRVIVVSDARVARLYGRAFVRQLAKRCSSAALLTFPAGERFKTRETKAILEDRLVKLGVGRDTVIVALGGGVTCDLAGFLAATWQRGVPVVMIPTTLLSMVDAALGGKTAVDLPGAKNAVGAFHQPASLWADVRTLRTLSERVYRAGLAEAVKMAATLDRVLFRRLEADASSLVRRDERHVTVVVERCLALKGGVVAVDENDVGRRAVLNFGHTVAHALEVVTEFSMSHGDAVAIGLVAEATLAERLTGLPPAHTQRIRSLLRTLGLPVRAPAGLDPVELVRAMSRDKKVKGGILRCALPARIGRALDGDDPTVPVDATRELIPLLVEN
jgi:3-dehydroquinate synthase